MSFINLKKIGDAQKKPAIVDVRSGDTVRVTQKIKEGEKFRSQVFEGVVIRTDRKNSHTARITVRKVTSGVGVEKSFLIHNPLVEKIEIVHRAKVRRKNLSFLRERSGKSARLANKAFDRVAVNTPIPTASNEATTESDSDQKPSEITAKTSTTDAVPADVAPAETNETTKEATEVLKAESQDSETIAESANPKGPAEPAE